MNHRLLAWAALLAGAAVVLGAFGAHGLRAGLSEPMRAVWETAVRYQMWHALGLGLIACLREETRPIQWCARLMLAGIFLFCGSLYLLALSGLGWLGMITPFGGLAFIAAWLLLAWSSWRKRHA